MYQGLRVIDADSHKMENPLVFFDYLEPAYRGRLKLLGGNCLRFYGPRLAHALEDEG